MARIEYADPSFDPVRDLESDPVTPVRYLACEPTAEVRSATRATAPWFEGRTDVRDTGDSVAKQ